MKPQEDLAALLKRVNNESKKGILNVLSKNPVMYYPKRNNSTNLCAKINRSYLENVQDVTDLMKISEISPERINNQSINQAKIKQPFNFKEKKSDSKKKSKKNPPEEQKTAAHSLIAKLMIKSPAKRVVSRKNSWGTCAIKLFEDKPAPSTLKKLANQINQDNSFELITSTFTKIATDLPPPSNSLNETCTSSNQLMGFKPSKSIHGGLSLSTISQLTNLLTTTTQGKKGDAESKNLMKSSLLSNSIQQSLNEEKGTFKHVERVERVRESNEIPGSSKLRNLIQNIQQNQISLKKYPDSAKIACNKNNYTVNAGENKNSKEQKSKKSSGHSKQNSLQSSIICYKSERSKSTEVNYKHTNSVSVALGKDAEHSFRRKSVNTAGGQKEGPHQHHQSVNLYEKNNGREESLNKSRNNKTIQTKTATSLLNSFKKRKIDDKGIGQILGKASQAKQTNHNRVNSSHNKSISELLDESKSFKHASESLILELLRRKGSNQNCSKKESSIFEKSTRKQSPDIKNISSIFEGKHSVKVSSLVPTGVGKQRACEITDLLMSNSVLKENIRSKIEEQSRKIDRNLSQILSDEVSESVLGGQKAGTKKVNIHLESYSDAKQNEQPSFAENNVPEKRTNYDLYKRRQSVFSEVPKSKVDLTEKPMPYSEKNSLAVDIKTGSNTPKDKNSRSVLVEASPEDNKKRSNILINENRPRSSHKKSQKKDSLYNSELLDTLITEPMNTVDFQEMKEHLISIIKQSFKFDGGPPETNLGFYKFVRLIGKGAFGKVHMALNILTDKYVAVKCIKKSLMLEKSSKAKIMNEISILKNLSHENIIKIYEVFSNEKYIFLVTEWASNGDMLNLIRKNGRLGEDLGRTYFLKLLKGLQACHENGILHRDIKLDNILIDEENNVKLCDFGISRSMKSGEIIFEQCGTPAYIAPEILENKGYKGFKADLWSLGVVLYAILTGEIPFKGQDIEEMTKMVLKGDFTVPKYLSQNAKDLIKRLLDKNPERRIDITEIERHPWITSNYDKLNVKGRRNLEKSQKLSTFPLSRKGSQEVSTRYVDLEIIEKVVSLGYPHDHLLIALKNRTLCHASACYYLLNK